MIHHTLKIVAMSPTENLISYPPKLDELSIVDFAVHNAIQLRSQLGITLFWGDNLVPKISFSVWFSRFFFTLLNFPKLLFFQSQFDKLVKSFMINISPASEAF